jgi:dTDP-4-dehydrorhamnose reductase|uniref:dTDP-4-dehydrorhamnose reductase n=1 Tax=Colwellia sp. C1 TaxID=1737566 RepID=A0A0N7J5M6_9GAMM|nr:dTDP-4-dehydrorhamnose reductase [Colwellia sp. C1]
MTQANHTNIVVIGKSGQLAWELAQLSGEEIRITCLGRNQINIFCEQSITNTLLKYQAHAVINACAYTAVDQAETDEKYAYQLNSDAVQNLAQVCKDLSLHLVHVSTDFVFKGDKGSPYLTGDALSPLGVYGASKAQGELAISNTLPEQSCIIRTSWVYSTHGNNFVKTMLKLMADKPELGIISDQIGSPTYAKDLANACLIAAKNKICGIHHWTDAGVASWYDFAVAIQEIAIEKDLLSKTIPIKPIRTVDYPTPAARPSYSVLDKTSCNTVFTDLPLIHWRTQLIKMMDAL